MKRIVRTALVLACALFICMPSTAFAKAETADAENSGAAAVNKSVVTTYIRENANNQFTRTFKYRSDGLLSSAKYRYYEKYSGNTTIKYVKYRYNAKKQLISISSKKSTEAAYHKDVTYTYNADGTIKKMNDKRFRYDAKKKLKKVYNSAYADTYRYNSKGLVSSYYYTYGGTETLTYDSKKNKKTSEIAYRYTTKTTYKNTYKNGLLVRRTGKDNNGSVTKETFKYTKMPVPSSVNAKINRQQWAIRNDDFLNVIGGKYATVNSPN